MAVRLCLSSNLKHLFYVLIAGSLYPSLVFAEFSKIDEAFVAVTKMLTSSEGLSPQLLSHSSRPLIPMKSSNVQAKGDGQGNSTSNSNVATSTITNNTTIISGSGPGSSARGLAGAVGDVVTGVVKSAADAANAAMKTATNVLNDNGLPAPAADTGKAVKAPSPLNAGDQPTSFTPTVSPQTSLPSSGSGNENLFKSFADNSGKVLQAMGALVAPAPTLFASAGATAIRAFANNVSNPSNAGGDNANVRTQTPPQPSGQATTTSTASADARARDAAALASMAMTSIPSAQTVAQTQTAKEIFSTETPKKPEATHPAADPVKPVSPTPKPTVASTQSPPQGSDIENLGTPVKGKAGEIKGPPPPPPKVADPPRCKKSNISQLKQNLNFDKCVRPKESNNLACVKLRNDSGYSSIQQMVTYEGLQCGIVADVGGEDMFCFREYELTSLECPGIDDTNDPVRTDH